jgi:hypothetical protein
MTKAMAKRLLLFCTIRIYIKWDDSISATRSFLRASALRKASQALRDKIFLWALALRKINQALCDYASVFALQARQSASFFMFSKNNILLLSSIPSFLKNKSRS